MTSEFEIPKQWESISHPKLELQLHTFLRFCGIGCYIGTLFGI